MTGLNKNDIKFSCVKSGVIDEANNVCMLRSISHSMVTAAISLKIKGCPSFTHTEGVTGSLEVHSRHVMSIVVPQSLNKETREVRRRIESRTGAEGRRGRSMKKKEGKGDYTISFEFFSQPPFILPSCLPSPTLFYRFAPSLRMRSTVREVIRRVSSRHFP